MDVTDVWTGAEDVEYVSRRLIDASEEGRHLSESPLEMDGPAEVLPPKPDHDSSRPYLHLSQQAGHHVIHTQDTGRGGVGSRDKDREAQSGLQESQEDLTNRGPERVSTLLIRRL